VVFRRRRIRLRRTILLCFIALSCVSGKAGGGTNDLVDALPPAAADEKTLDVAVQPRDPFWPIGYVPPSISGGVVAPAMTNIAEVVKKTTSRAPDLSEMLKIGGVIRKGGKFYATINGFTVQTGEVVTVVAEGEVYKFIVEKIDLKKVQIKPVKQ